MIDNNFKSKVNNVRKLTIDGCGMAVRKTYFNRAIVTGINIPLRRAVIERKVAKALSAHCRSTIDCISVHASIGGTSRENTFSFIEGHPLRILPLSRWPRAKSFWELGRLIADLENSIHPRIFDGVQIASRRIGNISRTYKTNSTAKPAGKSFSLGDLTLANIMGSRDSVILIDFEFAHLSSPAFDIGMLVAELDYRHERGTGQRRARQALIRGYIQGRGKLADVMAWRNRLASHQARSKHKKGGL